MFEKSVEKIQNYTSGLSMVEMESAEEIKKIDRTSSIQDQESINVSRNDFSKNQILQAVEQEEKQNKRRSIRNLSLLWEG